MSTDARAPIFIDSLLDDPAVFRELIETNAPYFPVQRYLSNDAQYRALSGGDQEMMIAPNFRGDWAYDLPLVEGSEALLFHPKLLDAASRLFETEHVRPQIVYTNLTYQLPFHQGGGHTDVPAFRGIDRATYPVWLLTIMGHSRLFEEERINIATAVAWFYAGKDGGFEYWPDGGDRAPQVHEGGIFNSAVMGDNDRMYHRVMPVGQRSGGLLSGMTLETQLRFDGGENWRITESDRVLAEFSYPSLRISVSWKAQIFRDAAEVQTVDSHCDDIDFDSVLARFYTDLERRSVDFVRPEDPLHDEAFVDLLSREYIRAPSVFTAAA